MSTTEQVPAAMAQDITTNGAGQIEVHCPADGRVVGHIPNHTADDVAKMAAALRAAQPAWEELSVEARCKHVLNWLDWIFDNEQHILELVQAEAGKSWGDASIETMVAVEVINYYTKHAKEFLADQSIRPHSPAYLSKKLRVHVRPYQLVGIIEPWNFPLAMPIMDTPQALIAGAAVLTKPSEYVPLGWTEVVRGWREEIGAPPVLDVANGLGETGQAVVDNVDMIQFTGSVRTGRKIGIRAAERLIPASLELGGNDPMIVLRDADLERAVNGAVWGSMFNAGQACLSVERVYVEEPVYDEFVSRLTKKINGLRQGMEAPGNLEFDIGAMANERQIEIVDRHVNDAIEKGARALTGGKRSQAGLFYEPTLLVDVDHSMQCMQEETFGPTVPVMKVKDEEEAVRLANDSTYGLGGSVYTLDKDRAERIAKRLEAGGVSHNNACMTFFQFPMPMGGWKESGLGTRFGGPGGILKYCRRQAYSGERIDLSSEMHWYPYTKAKSSISAKMVRLLGAHDWRRRLGRKGK